MRVVLNFLGMREWPRLPHSPRGTCVPNLRTTCSTCSAVQAFRREDEHAAVLLVFLGQRHFVVVRLITVEQFFRGFGVAVLQNPGRADVPLLFAYGVFRTGEYHHDTVVAVIDGLLHRNRIGDAAVVIGDAIDLIRFASHRHR